MLVGSPEQIPFEFQYELAVNHAVGRLYFDDLDDYTRYAEAVVEAENPERTLRPKKVGLFSVGGGDETTDVLQRFLIEPLARELPKRAPDWLVESWRDRKEILEGLLRGGEETPGVLLVACHGKRRPFGDPRQEALQGALVCHDGFVHAGDLADLEPEGRPLHGLIAGLFACHSVGTPVEDNFPEGGILEAALQEPEVIAETEFVARLPQALLARGALAVVGHVDRGWTASFRWLYKDKKTAAARSLEDSIVQVLEGHRLGHALRPIYRRYSNIAAHLLPLVEALINKRNPDEVETARHWTAFLDARNYVVLGDPAVYAGGPQKRPPTERQVPPGPDYAQPVYLEGNLARRARSMALSCDLDLSSWVHEVLEAELAPRSSTEPNRRSTKRRRDVPEPIQIALDARDDSDSPEMRMWLAESELLRPVDDPRAARLRVYQLGPRGATGHHEPAAVLGPLDKAVWVVTDRAGQLLSPACPAPAAAFEILLRRAQRFLLMELARRSDDSAMDLILKRRTREFLRPTATSWTEGEVLFHENEELEIEIRNHWDQPLWPYVLDFGVSGSLDPIHPDSGVGNPIAAGDLMILDDLRFGLPAEFPFDAPGQRPAGGHETLMLLGSTEPVDLDPFFGGKAPRAERQSSALGRILASILSENTLPSEKDLGDPSWGSVARSFLLRSDD